MAFVPWSKLSDGASKYQRERRVYAPGVDFNGATYMQNLLKRPQKKEKPISGRNVAFSVSVVLDVAYCEIYCAPRSSQKQFEYVSHVLIVCTTCYSSYLNCSQTNLVQQLIWSWSLSPISSAGWEDESCKLKLFPIQRRCFRVMSPQIMQRRSLSCR